MISKEIDQLKCDYFKYGERISVDCSWLQGILREKEATERKLRVAEALVETLRVLRDVGLPTYTLDIQA